MSRNLRTFQLANVLTILVFLLLAPAASAQVRTGTPPFGSFSGGPDIINLGNLNAHLTIPVLNKPGRGTNFKYDLSYDSSVWYPVTSGGITSWHLLTGWTTASPATMGYATYQTTGPYHCRFFQETQWITEYYYLQDNWIYTDSLGTAHAMVGAIQDGGAPDCGPGDGAILTTNDGSGYQLSVPQEIVYNTSGVVADLNFGSQLGTFKDRNGNQVTQGTGGVFTDTLGTTALTVTGSGTPSSPYVLTYTPPNTSSSVCTATNTAGVACWVISYVAYTVKSNFGCNGISEYPATVTNLVDKVTLPDGSYYQFTYEPTPGYSGDVTARVASIRLPTGGTTSFTYTAGGLTGSAVGSNDPIVCADGSAAGLTRQTPDGTWTYARSQVSGNQSQTKVTTPVGDDTVIYFQKDSSTTYPTSNFYETARFVYQGASSSNVVLRNLTTCYNGNASACPAAAVSTPITQRTIFDQYGSNGLQCKHNYLYSAGGLTEQDDYDYGSGSPGGLLRQILITYASLGNITTFPQQVTVKNGSGAVVSQTNYNYDETTPTATSGIAQHGAVYSSRGNLTSINYPVGGLTSHFTYYDTGSPSTSQDVNGATTTYNYSSASCQMAFPTSNSEPLSMSKSFAWNCTGGVMTSLTDENSQVTSTTYDDSYFWRPHIVTDQLGNQTNIYYGGPTLVTPWLKFNNNNSVTSVAHNSDGLGRPAFDQRYQSPTAQTYDTVSYAYDADGRPYSTTMPCSVGYGLNCPGGTPKTTQTYDALNRPLVTTDGGGGTLINSYSQNDVLVTLGPAPSGEHAKQRQLEYDSLGRLTSVCEITTLAGSGSCGQNTAATGYLTKYTYDALGNLLTVTQNAQPTGTPQPRTYAYDAVSRLTSEKNPEANQTAVTYTYDTDSTCGTSNGDLVKLVDANGNTTCYTYDVMHRVTWVKYPSGANSANSFAKFFWYDAPYSNNTSSTANLKGRMSAAGTCTTPTCSVNTHSWTHYEYAYDGDGRMTDVWQQTPNSGGIYHTTATYWPNGAVASLSGIPGEPTFTYGVDGEGRNNSASQGSTGLVSSVLFNPASQATDIGFANGDHDDYQYDPNTGREKQYSFTVGATPQTETGVLTWNANGTLQQLAISDPFNSSDNQTCTYGYDDLVRVSSANCGSVWSQTFSYDAFGNITKSGSSAWQPGYNTSNRYVSGSYDANGNLLSDPFYTYTWDSSNMPVAIGTRALTYDVFGRTVEKSDSGTYQWTALYTPIGRVAFPNGQSNFNYLELNLPGGTRVIACNTCTQQYFSHTDWLGSTRLMSNVGPRTVAGTQAFAPFGESYAVSGTLETAFAGMVTDTASGEYDADARRQHPGQGRWISPDPAGLAAVDPSNPQSWNRYAYVLNNPLAFIDPLGLCGEHGQAHPPTPCADPDNPYPGGGGCSLDGCGNGLDGTGGGTGCYLNGSPVGCNTLGPLLSNPSGATVLCQSSACMPGVPGVQVVDGPNGTAAWQQWVPWYLYGHALLNPDGSAYEGTAGVVWHWATIATDQQIGMNIFQYGAFTQADRLVKAGTAYTAAVGGVVVSAPTAAAVGGSAYVQYNVVQFYTSFGSAVLRGPVALPLDMTSPGGWLGYAAGLLTWWEQD